MLCSFSSPTDVGSHNPLLFGASILAGTRSFLQLMWDPQSTPFGTQHPYWHNALCPTPFGAQPPRWHITRCLAQPTTSKYCPLWAFPFGLPLKVFKTCLPERGFHTLIKNVLLSSPTDVGSHNPPLSGPSVLASTHFILQLMWDPPIHPFRGPASLLVLISFSN